MPSQSTCSIDGCDERVRGRTWCARHYGLWYRHGSTDDTGKVRNLRRLSVPERFALYLDTDGPLPERRPELGRCFVWTRLLNAYGYGVFSHGHGSILAHRFAYEAVHGEIPEGMEIDHLCRNPSCARVDHLEAVTHAENVRRGDAGAVAHARSIARTHCNNGHRWVAENIYEHKGCRSCRTCRLAADRRWVMRKKLRGSA